MLSKMTKFRVRDWLTPNIGIKRWMTLAVLGISLSSLGFGLGMVRFVSNNWLWIPDEVNHPAIIIGLMIIGAGLFLYSTWRMIKNVLAPYRRLQSGQVIDAMIAHRRRQIGFKFVALGGGTGLPASLRGMKQYTSNITAVVTVADDGGSSGRLRRDLGVLPPGDLRNNIAALADENSLLTQLFQYRFQEGDLQGHSFGNLFIAALANIVEQRDDIQKNSLAEALVEVERVLNIQGRVIPSTLDDVILTANLKLHGSSRSIKVRGESQIEKVDGVLESIAIEPENAQAYAASVQAIIEADIIVIGPGSLYTSILPNLMVKGIADALRATDAFIIYVCNVATQPVETENYTVAEHVMALENHIGRGVFQAVLANNIYPIDTVGKTDYVLPASEHHEILQRYDVHYTDLIDNERPWRHDTNKLAAAILRLAEQDIEITPIIASTSKELV
jgi:uncharacterized cofD-like protein